MGVTSGLVLTKSSSRLLVVSVVPWGDVLLFSYPLCPRTACERQLSLLLVFSIGSHPRFRVASECLPLLFSVLLPAEPGEPEKLFLPWALGLRWRKRCTYLFPSHSAKSAGCSPSTLHSGCSEQEAVLSACQGELPSADPRLPGSPPQAAS